MRVFFALFIAPLCLLSLPGYTASSRAEPDALETVIVTAVRMSHPLRVTTDPALPRQPLPAHDGADYLKTIPGFNVVRKGGTDGDPLFRGMAASRINILVDGTSLSGGCSSRMDPPTAYVFPETFDRITVIKGPQTVRHGAGNSAATVLFERDPRPRDSAGWDIRAALTATNFGRNDAMLQVDGGSDVIYARISATQSEADDYRDGNGDPIHSAYERWSTDFAVGWTPSDRSWVELGVGSSDGEAAYADRMMDGAAFERDAVTLKFRIDDLSGPLRALEGQVYSNYIDHVMDNFSLRVFRPSMMMPWRSASNPDRDTTGGRLVAELDWTDTVAVILGTDAQFNAHSVRSTMNQDAVRWQHLPRETDARFSSISGFGELDWEFIEDHHLVTGYRLDHWEAQDRRDHLSVGMMGMLTDNPTVHQQRDRVLKSGFLRYEWPLRPLASSAMVGIGHVERFPDYWELFGTIEGVGSTSAFKTAPEETTQLDIGLLHNSDRLSASVNLFATDIDNFILVQSDWRKGARLARVSRNIDAYSWGAEVSLGYALTNHWQIDQSLAWVRGDNRTDNEPLAQQPPLESRTSLNAQFGSWRIGALLRLVDDQHRYAINQGTVIGQDLGPSNGFAIVSLNAAWDIRKDLSLLLGVDNLGDVTYAEHISRAGAMVPGYQPDERVNEPGRTLWAKIMLSL